MLARRRLWPLARLAPGLGLCGLVAAGAYGLQWVERGLFGQAWLEALVLAVLIGAAVRTAWTPPTRWLPGIVFGAKTLLEAAVVLLGASVSADALLGAGPALLAGIAGVVALAIPFSYGLGRMLGLPRRMAVLVACGNSICGNSAIAAVAPVIGADSEDVAASIAFTAALGVIVVLALPALAIGLRMSPRGFGVLAGLTVYAAPQVLAATAPLGSLSAQVGTLVKLVRVLMLGPVVLLLFLANPRPRPRDAVDPVAAAGSMIQRLVPWFIIGFIGLIGARSFGLIPIAWLAPAAHAASFLTIVSMAALGLGVDVRVISRAGPRVVAAVSLSLLGLGVIAFGLVHVLGMR